MCVFSLSPLDVTYLLARLQVTPLEPDEMEEQLRIVNQEAGAAFTGIVDHAHGSYSLDLDAAARQLEQADAMT